LHRRVVWREQGTRQLTDFPICNRVQLIELKYCYRICCCADPHTHRRHWFTGIVAHASGSDWLLRPIKPHRMYLHFSTQSTPIHHPSTLEAAANKCTPSCEHKEQAAMARRRLLAVLMLLVVVVAASTFHQAAAAGRGLAAVEKFADLEPKPKPKPEPMPKQMPKPEPKPMPKPEPKPEPKPKPMPKPEPKPEPKHKPMPKPEPKPEPMPKPEPKPKPDPKPEPPPKHKPPTAYN
uniref:Uncharacterized protein n=3 Tax=Triticinae TaxID=1648030 RepID=A0A453LNR6_AEGTS